MSNQLPPKRLDGLDLARVVAVLGMLVVSFKWALAGPNPDGESSLVWLINQIEGRASATFFVLSGTVIALHFKSVLFLADLKPLRQRQFQMLRRGLVVLLLGIGLSLVWPANILPLYGLVLLLGALLSEQARHRLLLLTVLIGLSFVFLLLTDWSYKAEWLDGNPRTLVYQNFWTWKGFLKELFYNGFYPFIPWAAFFCWGMWMGRPEIRDQRRRYTYIIGGLLTAFLADGLSSFSINFFWDKDVRLESQALLQYLGTDARPPAPLFLLSAGGTATAIIFLCEELVQRWTKLLDVFVRAGRSALSLYVFGLAVGLPVAAAWQPLGTYTIQETLLFALGFFALSLLGHVLWRRFYKRGPLELLLRRL